MPVSTLTCPKCSATLKPANPVAVGKKIKCPKCGTIFEAREDENKITAKPSKAAPAKTNPSKSVKPAKPSPAAAAAPSKPKYQGEEDEGPAIYGVVRDPHVERPADDDEEMDEDDPRNISYVPDLSIKDPRGPAQAAVIKPSNFLMFVGVIGCLLGFLAMGYGIFPFIFTEYWPNPEDFFKDKQGKTVRKEWKELKHDEREEIEKATIDEQILHGIYIGAGAFILIYNALIAIGGVKMQNLESYRWSMTSSILATIGGGGPLWLITGLPIGIWNITTLRRVDVLAGYEARRD